MKIIQVTQVSNALVSVFGRLIPQLSSSCPPPTRADLEQIVSSPATILLIAQDPTQDSEIVGTLTLVLYRTPTGMHAWIEDVVVDVKYRRMRVGTALIQAALMHAKEAGARTVDLTSRPSRKAANRLYRQLGFVQRETNVYRYTLEP